jgi:ATP-binding cassette, subfamily B, bacterial PglK
LEVINCRKRIYIMRFYKNILNPLFLFLNRSDKIRGAWVVALMVLNAALDFFSLGSFLPLVFLLVNPDFISSNKYLKGLYTAFDFTSPSWFIISFTSCVLIFTVCKNIIAFWITRAKADYCFATGSELCARMLSRYIESSYLNFTQLDFTKELNRIANQPIAFANNIIMPLANLVSEGLVFLTLLLCIAIYNVNVFVLLVVILIPVGLVYLFQRKGLSQTSIDLKEKYPLTLKYAFQVVEGLIDIKAFGKEAYFKNRFNEASQSLAKTFSRDHTNQTSASRLTEVIAAFIICSIIVYSVLVSQNYQQTLLLLGVYVGASFRMVSSLNRILNSMLQIKSHEYLFKELETLSHYQLTKSKEDHTPLSFTKAIQLDAISFKYPNGAMALNEASLVINRGDKIALIGKSGTGKTTLLLILLQFLQEYTGKIMVDGVEIQSDHLKAWRKLVGYVPQSPYLLDGTISENIAFGFSAEEADMVKIKRLVHDLDLEEMVSQLPAGVSTQIGEKGVKLSGGQRQRIAIARALYADAEVLLLDEITNQLDAQSEQEIVQTLEKVALQQKTILLITHHDHLLKHFDRVLTLDRGVLFEKKFSQALAN